MQVEVNMTKVDWALFRNQKNALVNVISGQDYQEQELLDGLVYLLDDIQDQASDILGEEMVFGDIKDLK